MSRNEALNSSMSAASRSKNRAGTSAAGKRCENAVELFGQPIRMSERPGPNQNFPFPPDRSRQPVGRIINQLHGPHQDIRKMRLFLASSARERRSGEIPSHDQSIANEAARMKQARRSPSQSCSNRTLLRRKRRTPSRTVLARMSIKRARLWKVIERRGPR